MPKYNRHWYDAGMATSRRLVMNIDGLPVLQCPTRFSHKGHEWSNYYCLGRAFDAT